MVPKTVSLNINVFYGSFDDRLNEIHSLCIEMFFMSEAFFAELIFTIVTHNVSRMFCECSNEICVLNASRFG